MRIAAVDVFMLFILNSVSMIVIPPPEADRESFCKRRKILDFGVSSVERQARMTELKILNNF